MIDICAEQGWLATVLRAQQLLQCIVQARWLDDPVVLTLPHVEEQNLSCFEAINIWYDLEELFLRTGHNDAFYYHLVIQ